MVDVAGFDGPGLLAFSEGLLQLDELLEVVVIELVGVNHDRPDLGIASESSPTALGRLSVLLLMILWLVPAMASLRLFVDGAEFEGRPAMIERSRSDEGLFLVNLLSRLHVDA